MLLLRHLADDAEHFVERAARSDDAVEVVDVTLRVAEVVDLVLHPAHLERLLDLDLHFLDFERLLHVVERAGLHGFDRRRDGAERRHQDDAARRMQGLRGLEDVEPAAAAHLEVAHHDVEEALVQLLDRGIAVGRLFDVVSGFGQRLRHAAAKRVVIVSNQNPAHMSSRVSIDEFVRGLHRQRDANLGPASRRGLQIDAPIVRIHDLAHDGESQARTLGFGRVERTERPFGDL